jgi:predicted RNA-binding Zn ribbon-like protein
MTAPADAVRIERFANTFDLESGREDLATPAALARWLAAEGLLEPGSEAGEADLRDCLDLRGGIREALSVTGRPDPHRLSRANSLLAGVPLLAHLDRTTDPEHPPGPVLVPDPALPPARRAWAELALAWVRLVLTGQVERLRRCAEHTCGEVFWDGSKNRSRRWCSMRVCGNRTKARKHSARAGEPRGGPP